MRKPIILALIAAASVANGGMAREFIYEVGAFDKLSQRGNIDVVYRCLSDSAGIARYESDEDLSESLEITNDKGKLSIRETRHSKGKLPKVYVYSDYLAEVKQEGKSSVEVDLNNRMTPRLNVGLTGNGTVDVKGINTPEVKASITTGNGRILLAGKARKARFDLMGTGLIQSLDLKTENVKCNVVGTGAIACNPAQTLDVMGIGTTKIYYMGDPEIKKTGGARLEPYRPEESEIIP